MDHAIWRIKVIPFEVTIPDAEQDKRLPEKLRKELRPACSRGRSKAASSGSAAGSRRTADRGNGSVEGGETRYVEIPTGESNA
jgi:hypothetical protein